MCYAAMKAQAQKNDMMGLGFKVEIRSNVFEGITYPMGQMPFGYINANGEKICESGQFGLLPDWVDESRGGAKYAKKWSTYNARSETLFEKPTFREAIKQRRAIIPVLSFLEIADVGGHDFKFQVLREDRKSLYLAALWEFNRQYKLHSCSIITSEPMPLVKEFHSRSPILIPEMQIDAWLNPLLAAKDAIAPFLKVSDSSGLIIEKEAPKKGAAN